MKKLAIAILAKIPSGNEICFFDGFFLLCEIVEVTPRVKPVKLTCLDNNVLYVILMRFRVGNEY